MDNEFEKKVSKLQYDDGGFEFLGYKHMAQFYTRAGVSSFTSWFLCTEEMDEESLHEIPDYVLSDTIDEDLPVAINVCTLGLRDSKYFPDEVKAGSSYGAIPEGQREGASLEGWEDFSIIGCDGNLVYTEEMLSAFEKDDPERLSTALQLIVKDICDDGRMLSEDWYYARIIDEYFRNYPVLLGNAFLIGWLYKELCIKQSFEADLSTYYASLADSQQRRQKGTTVTKQKAEELREYCVGLFADLAEKDGPRLMLAPAELRAKALRKAALENRPDDFVRAGKPYSEEWFLRNIIEDRKLDIVQVLERRKAEKRL